MSKAHSAWTALLPLILAAALAVGARASEISCPAELQVDEISGDSGTWIASPGRRNLPLDGASVVNGVPGDEGGPAPVVLAPDEESSDGRRVTQGWDLDAYRDGGLILVCRYRDSSAHLTAVLDAAVSRCVVSFDATPVPAEDTTVNEHFLATCR